MTSCGKLPSRYSATDELLFEHPHEYLKCYIQSRLNPHADDLASLSGSSGVTGRVVKSARIFGEESPLFGLFLLHVEMCIDTLDRTPRRCDKLWQAAFHAKYPPLLHSATRHKPLGDTRYLGWRVLPSSSHNYQQPSWTLPRDTLPLPWRTTLRQWNHTPPLQSRVMDTIPLI